MRKIKVVQINPSFDMGGIETMMVQLCNHLDKDKFEVLLCSLSANMPKANELLPEIKVVSLGYGVHQLRGGQLLFYGVLALFKLGRWLRKVQPDIVHVHAYFSMYMLISLAVKLYFPKAKVVKTLHTSGMFYDSNKLIDRFRLWVEQRATAFNRTYVVGICKQVELIAVKHFSKVAVEIRKIYNGVDLSRFSHNLNSTRREELLGNKQMLIVYVARLVDGKNHHFLIDVFYELKAKGINTMRLLLIGDGDYLQEIQQEINKRNLQEEILCLGRSKEIPTLLSLCDFAVFPSDYEGFSLALLEKMASSLPVISSDIPPFKEIISSEINGVLVSLSDKVAWENAIRKMMENNTTRNNMGKAALNRSKDFSVEKMVYGYEKLYQYACYH